MKINPNQIPIFSILMFSFLKFLKNRGSQILYEKRQNIFKYHFFNEALRKGDRTYVDIKFSMERPTTGELKQRINMFLEGLTH